MTPRLPLLSSKNETTGDITHIHEIVSATYVRLQMPAGKIKYELSNVGDTVIPGADDSCWAADDHIQSAFANLIQKKECGTDLAPGVVA